MKTMTAEHVLKTTEVKRHILL